MKTIVVGDLHGRIEIVDYVLGMKDHNVVFIGDYLDSFHRTKEDQISTLYKVLKAAEKDPERVTALMGNHELSYLDSSQRCSGHSTFVQVHTIHLRAQMYRLLKSHVWVGDYLISHAGISRLVLEEDSLDAVLTYLDDVDRHKEVGRARSGVKKSGGLYWCDWYKEFRPLKSVPQIVGHSAYRKEVDADRGIILKANEGVKSYNIDCLETVNPEILILGGTDGPEVHNLNDYIYYDRYREDPAQEYLDMNQWYTKHIKK